MQDKISWIRQTILIILTILMPLFFIGMCLYPDF